MDTRFQVCFTPLAAVLFAFPSRYLFTIGHQGVFSLGGWSPRIQTAFHVHRPNWDPGRPGPGFRIRGFHPLWRSLPAASPSLSNATSRSRNPGKQASRFGLLRFRSPLLTQCHRFLFLWVLRCFTSPRLASADYLCSSADGTPRRVPGCPIRTPPDQSLLTAPRGLSQSSASFIAS